jgi:hypothetical protein
MAQQIKITQTSNADMNIGVPKNLTAVEWLAESLMNFNGDDNPWFDIPLSLLEQAKQMEKEQIMDAIVNNQNGLLRRKTVLEAEQYYNETYGTEQSTK